VEEDRVGVGLARGGAAFKGTFNLGRKTGRGLSQDGDSSMEDGCRG